MKRLHQIKAGGPKLYWSVMCALTRKFGGFTVPDVVELCRNATYHTVERYIHACKAGGHLDVVGERPHTKPSLPPFLLLAVKVTSSMDAPFERNGEGGKLGAAAQQMWTAMRGLPTFTTRDISLHASTDEVSVPLVTARVYCWKLRQAGYLQELGRNGRWAVLRIAPGKNLGPLPPAVMGDGSVVDRNARQRRRQVAP